MGGAYLSSEIKAGHEGPPPIIGSVLLAVASSEEEVREKLKQDVYVKEGVWDMDRVIVHPVS